jgi:methyl-accepting chemotaxis protein
MSTSKNRLVTKFLGKIPLQAVLIVPFVVQIAAVVGLVGYLSFRNGQRGINDLASQLQNQTSLRIDQHLDTLLATPLQINQINLDAYELGNLNLQDLDRTRRYFHRQMKVFRDFGYIDFGSAKGGEFAGIGREDDGSLYLELMRSADKGRYKRYALDNQGNPTRVIGGEEYDYPKEDWYANAAKAGKPVWSSIYNWSDRPDVMSISSSYPVYDQTRKLVGVIGIDVILTQLNGFLQNLKVSPSGKIFLLERDGLVVATSSGEKPYRMKEGKAERLKILEIQDPLIHATAQHLIDRFGNFSQITKSQQLDFNRNGTSNFVQVIPWQDKLGLDWLIVVVIPESDFMAQINANTRTTFVLSVAALIVAIIIGIFTTRWVTQPLVQLNLAAKDLALGQWDKTVDIERSDTIGQLAKSFNNMAFQLKDSFDKLNEVIVQANQVGMKVTSSTRQITKAGKQLEATVTQQAVSTNEVRATATSIASTSGQLAKTMEDIAQKAQVTAVAASNSQVDLREMAGAMHQLATATKSISAKLGSMNEKANNINSVVSAITKVADQTNLISLNAAIEAEKAGESGAGFAVVAREVRWLADKAGYAASEIEEMVKEIQTSVANGVMEMDKFSQQVSHYVKQVNHISGQMAQVIDQVQSLTPQFEIVSHSMEGQSEGARQISTAISQLSEASQQTVASLQETNQVLDQLNDTAQVLQGIISSSVTS